MSTGRRLWAYAATLPAHLLGGLAGALLAGACQLLLVLYAKPLLDNATNAAGVSVDGLVRVTISIFIFGVGISVGELAYMYLLDYVAQGVVLNMRGDLFRHLQALSLGFFEDASTGALVSRATNDLSVIQTRLNNDLAALLRQPVMIVGLLVGILVLSSWQLMAFTLLVGGAMLPVINFTSARMKLHTAQIQESLADLTAHLTESLGGIRVVQSFGASEHEIARFEADNRATRRAMMRAVRVRAVLRPLLHLISIVGLILLLVAGGWLYSQGLATMGDIGLVLASVPTLSGAFKDFGRARLAWAETMAASERVFELIDTAPDLVDAPDAVDLGAIEGRLEFRNTGFHYRTGSDVLTDIDLHIEPGQMVALVGASGSGKTTLANLVPRLYDVTAGALLIDGHDVRAVTRASLRAQIGIVPQQTVLFRGTVADNIRYGKPEATDAEVEVAARAANAHDFIVALPDGYDTEVGERAVKLSGGQAQRVAIARAILRDPRILILDEATSALDTASEALVQEALDRLMQGRTSLVIAHRLSTVANADRIVVLDEGRIAEQGPPAELLAQPDSLYRRYHALQAGASAE